MRPEIEIQLPLHYIREQRFTGSLKPSASTIWKEFSEKEHTRQGHSNWESSRAVICRECLSPKDASFSQAGDRGQGVAREEGIRGQRKQRENGSFRNQWRGAGSQDNLKWCSSANNDRPNWGFLTQGPRMVLFAPWFPYPAPLLWVFLASVSVSCTWQSTGFL